VDGFDKAALFVVSASNSRAWDGGIERGPLRHLDHQGLSISGSGTLHGRHLVIGHRGPKAHWACVRRRYAVKNATSTAAGLGLTYHRNGPRCPGNIQGFQSGSPACKIFAPVRGTTSGPGNQCQRFRSEGWLSDKKHPRNICRFEKDPRHLPATGRQRPAKHRTHDDTYSRRVLRPPPQADGTLLRRQFRASGASLPQRPEPCPVSPMRQRPHLYQSHPSTWRQTFDRLHQH